MSNYKVNWIELKASKQGKPYAKATLIDEKGGQITDVTIFGNFPNFTNIRAGFPIAGTLTSSLYKGKTQYTLNEEKTNTLYAKPKTDMDKVMAKKEASIEIAQGRKSDSIKIAACARDATLMTSKVLEKLTSQGTDWSIEEAQALWVQWRKWLAENFGDSEAPF